MVDILCSTVTVQRLQWNVVRKTKMERSESKPKKIYVCLWTKWIVGIFSLDAGHLLASPRVFSWLHCALHNTCAIWDGNVQPKNSFYLFVAMVDASMSTFYCMCVFFVWDFQFCNRQWQRRKTLCAWCWHCDVVLMVTNGTSTHVYNKPRQSNLTKACARQALQRKKKDPIKLFKIMAAIVEYTVESDIIFTNYLTFAADRMEEQTKVTMIWIRNYFIVELKIGKSHIFSLVLPHTHTDDGISHL